MGVGSGMRIDSRESGAYQIVFSICGIKKRVGGLEFLSIPEQKSLEPNRGVEESRPTADSLGLFRRLRSIQFCLRWRTRLPQATSRADESLGR